MFKSNSEFTVYHANGKKMSLVHSKVDLLPSSTKSVFLLTTSLRKGYGRVGRINYLSVAYKGGRVYRIGEGEGEQNMMIVKVTDTFCFPEQEIVCGIDHFVSDLVLL